jgi:SAM-dependent methyltransferase
MPLSVPALPARTRAWIGAGVLALGLGLSASAPALSRADCDTRYKPVVGQAGKDVVWVPTPDELVQRMLIMTRTTADDLVYDLGSGDGKIAIAAAREFGATAVGIEYNPDMAKLAQCYVESDGLTAKVRIVEGDIFKEDFSKATVVTMYLLPELNLRLRPTLLAMPPGTRVASHRFSMGDWEPDETSTLEYRSAYLWIVPAQAAGTWKFQEQNGGPLRFTVRLAQKYQKISGEITLAGRRQPLVGAALRGQQIIFAFNDAHGVTRTLTGRLQGNAIHATVRRAGGGETLATGTRN